jgi:hypothetical protein
MAHGVAHGFGLAQQFLVGGACLEVEESGDAAHIGLSARNVSENEVEGKVKPVAPRAAAGYPGEKD